MESRRGRTGARNFKKKLFLSVIKQSVLSATTQGHIKGGSSNTLYFQCLFHAMNEKQLPKIRRGSLMKLMTKCNDDYTDSFEVQQNAGLEANFQDANQFGIRHL